MEEEEEEEEEEEGVYCSTHPASSFILPPLDITQLTLTNKQVSMILVDISSHVRIGLSRKFQSYARSEIKAVAACK